MRETKRRFENFNLYDYQGVEAHLSQMAAEGWRLEKTGNWFWTYRRAEAANVHYAVTYQHNLSQFDPELVESQEVLAEICESAGWKFLCNWAQMQIFITEDADPVPLETDEALRLEVIHRTMKKHVYPGNLLLLALTSLMNVLTLHTLIQNPSKLFQENGRIFSALMYLSASLLILVNLGSYLLWRRKSEKSIAAGGTCVSLRPGYRKAALIVLALVLLVAAGYAVLEAMTERAEYALFYLAYMLLLFLLIAIVHGTKSYLKRRGASREKNMTITMAVDILLALALTGGLTFAAIRFSQTDSDQGGVYKYRQQNWDINPIAIPLTNTDITGEEFDHIQRDELVHGSFLLPIRSYWETVLRESDNLRRSLTYTIRDPKTQWLYDAVLKDILGPYTEDVLGNGTFEPTSTWQTEDPASWGADAVYRHCWDGKPEDKWLLCWPGRIVTIRPDETPSEEEMALIGQALRP